MDNIAPHAERITQALLDAVLTYDWNGFERLILLLLTADGSTGSLTPASGDNGIDVIINSRNGVVVAQCKAYSLDTKVSAKEIREFLGAVVSVKAERGYFFTTSYFTDQAKEFASAQQSIELIDRTALARRLASALTQQLKDDDHDVAEDGSGNAIVNLLRIKARAAKKLSELGQLDKALEAIYELAHHVESIDLNNEDRDRLIQLQLRIDELNHKIQKRSWPADLPECLDKDLAPLVLLEMKREADYIRSHVEELDSSYAGFGISATDMIKVLSDDRTQTSTGGWWLINREHDKNSEWIPYHICQDCPASPEEYPSNAYIHVHRRSHQWNWVMIDRLTHTPMAAFREVTSREKDVRSARQLLGDTLLIDFLRAARNLENGPIAIKAVNSELDSGKTLDSIFYTGEHLGFSLSALRRGSTLLISLGCQVAPLAGDGGGWAVALGSDNHIIAIKAGGTWIS